MQFSIQTTIEDYFTQLGFTDKDGFAVKIARFYYDNCNDLSSKTILFHILKINTVFFRINNVLDHNNFILSLLKILDAEYKKKLNKSKVIIAENEKVRTVKTTIPPTSPLTITIVSKFSESLPLALLASFGFLKNLIEWFNLDFSKALYYSISFYLFITCFIIFGQTLRYRHSNEFDQNKKRIFRIWKGIGIFLVILSFLFLFLGFISTIKIQTNNETKPTELIPTNTPTQIIHTPTSAQFTPAIQATPKQTPIFIDLFNDGVLSSNDKDEKTWKIDNPNCNISEHNSLVDITLPSSESPIYHECMIIPIIDSNQFIQRVDFDISFIQMPKYYGFTGLRVICNNNSTLFFYFDSKHQIGVSGSYELILEKDVVIPSSKSISIRFHDDFICFLSKDYSEECAISSEEIDTCPNIDSTDCSTSNYLDAICKPKSLEFIVRSEKNSISLISNLLNIAIYSGSDEDK